MLDAGSPLVYSITMRSNNGMVIQFNSRSAQTSRTGPRARTGLVLADPRGNRPAVARPGDTEGIHRLRNPDTHRVPGERDVHALARPDTRYQMLTSRQEPGRRHASFYTRKTLSLATEHGHVCSASFTTGISTSSLPAISPRAESCPLWQSRARRRRVVVDDTVSSAVTRRCAGG